jgi:hypothetical protein
LVDTRSLPVAEADFEILPPIEENVQFALPVWSPDGRSLVGQAVDFQYASVPGVYVYDIETRNYTKYGENVPEIFSVTWLNDGLRVLVLSRSRVTLVDTRTNESRVLIDGIEGVLVLGGLSVPSDDSAIYFSSGSVEADVWLGEFR